MFKHIIQSKSEILTIYNDYLIRKKEMSHFSKNSFFVQL